MGFRRVGRLTAGFAAVVVAAALLPGASHAAAPRPGMTGEYPLYNEVYGVATHNSYWLNRSDKADFYASGTQEILSDQLLHEHVRALELDIHSEGAPAGRWKVYRTSDSEDFTCRYLDDCLQMLRNFQYAVPRHEAINVMIELKNVVPRTGATFPWIPTNANFDGTHSIEQLDDTLRAAFGAALYTPADFLSRCPQGSTIVACMASAGWPTIDQLRGKFVVNLIGNWSTAAADWVQYATHDVQHRVAFPIQSVFEVDPVCTKDWLNPARTGTAPIGTRVYGLDDAGTATDLYCIRDISDFNASPPIDPAAREAAFQASAFWQLEDVGPDGTAKAAKLLAHHGLVRAADSYDYRPGCDAYSWQCQENRIDAGYQFVQTDYPWHVIGNTAAAQRLRRRDGTAVGEPGARVYVHTGPSPAYWPYVYDTAPATSQRWWETTVSTTRNGNTWGKQTDAGIFVKDILKTCPAPDVKDQSSCTDYARSAQDGGNGSLRIASADDSSWIQIGRQKRNNEGGPGFNQESVEIYLRVAKHNVVVKDIRLNASRYGTCRDTKDPNSDDVSWTCIGNMIALSVDNRGTGATVHAYSAGRLSTTGAPDWQEIAAEDFDAPLPRQGISAFGDVLFAGLRRTDALHPDSSLRDVALSDLPGRGIPAGATVTDLSQP
jgi:calcium-dependent phosphoinositide phospholipase C